MARPNHFLLTILIGFCPVAPALAQQDSLLMNDPVPIPIEENANEVMTVVEIMPEFPGGQEALFRYLSTSVKYPDVAIDSGIQGMVYVQFVVMTNGTISAARILRGVSPEIDAEALRVVNAMPAWKPGEQRGKKVRVQYNLPLRFTIQDRKTRKLRK